MNVISMYLYKTSVATRDSNTIGTGSTHYNPGEAVWAASNYHYHSQLSGCGQVGGVCVGGPAPGRLMTLQWSLST